HFNEVAQQGGGLVGALVVEPRDATAPAPDREYTVVTGEWVTAAAPAAQAPAPMPAPASGTGGMPGMMGSGMTGVASAMMGTGSSGPAFDTFSVNGKAYP